MTNTFSSSYKNYYGDMWQYRELTEVEIITIGVFEIVGGMSSFATEGFLFQNNQELVCEKAGLYDVVWNLCFIDGQIQEWEGTIFINEINQTQTSGTVKLGASDEVNMQGTGHIRLEIGDIVTVRMTNNSTTQDATIITSNMKIARLDK